MDRADLIVIDDPVHIPHVYRKNVVIAVLAEDDYVVYPPNVVFLNKCGDITTFVTLVDEILNKIMSDEVPA